jgi:Amt family ammonium transporter
LGVFILWIGWFGFNPGSVLILAGGSGAVAARAAVTTILSSAAAALSALFYAHWTSPDRDYDLGMALNGALAGLVSITGPCAFVEMWAAVAIGILGGVLYVGSSRFVLNVMKIDDPLDATPVHMFCGMFGIIAGAFFANPVLLEPFFAPPTGGCVQVPSGVFYGGNTYVTKCKDVSGVITTKSGGTILGALVANAVVEIVCILVWVAVFMTPIFLALHKAGILRVASDVESVGLDVSHHGGEAYPELFHAYEFADAKKSTRFNGEKAAAQPQAQADVEKQEVPLASDDVPKTAEAVTTV